MVYKYQHTEMVNEQAELHKVYFMISSNHPLGMGWWVKFL